jgi:Fe-S-cluster-containing dehydrogenase component
MTEARMRPKTVNHAKYRFTIDLKNCTACRLCEVACSYALTQSFNPELSSIRVSREDGNVTLSLKSTCSCTTPLCAKYCIPRAIVDVEME